MNTNTEITVSEARNAANAILTYLDIVDVLNYLELDEGDVLTQLILEGTIDLGQLDAFTSE